MSESIVCEVNGILMSRPMSVFECVCVCARVRVCVRACKRERERKAVDINEIPYLNCHQQSFI